MPAVAAVYSRAQHGMEAPEVRVEVHITPGVPRVNLVGLPETVMKESRERVRSALLTSQFFFPSARITFNLAPAELPKEGVAFDLPMAIGTLLASHQLKVDQIEHYEFIGELSLTGELRPTRGAIATAIAAAQSQRILVLPQANLAEALLIDGLKCLPATHLLEVCAHLMGEKPIPFHTGKALPSTYAITQNLSEVKGHPFAKRALEIAAAGKHHLLFSG
ncbi:MAG: ATP-binding protein, partial [Gammaproteobacteria bacterium]|nr:ATP-binding protein [Gammaproteobacteria bacterium]